MKVAGVIFDLDGTITQPCLDFDQIRADIGAIQGPILEAMETLAAPQRRRAEEILQRHELWAAENSQLNPGAGETFARLRGEARFLAVITRNRRDSVERVCRRHELSFDAVVTREDGPVKPDPFPVLEACRRLKLAPGECLVVGDYLFDLLSARRAGAWAVLLTSQPSWQQYRQEAHCVIERLADLHQVIAGVESGQVAPVRAVGGDEAGESFAEADGQGA